MAAQDPTIAFVVLVSSPVVPPREQAAFAVDSYLRNTGVPHGVFRAIPRAVGMSLPGRRVRVRRLRRHAVPAPDDQPVLRRLRHRRRLDAHDPGRRADHARHRDRRERRRHRALLRGRQPRHPRATASSTRCSCATCRAGSSGCPAPATSEPRIAGAQPVQTYFAAPVPEPRWLGDGDVVLALALAAVALIVLGPLARPGRPRGRGGDGPGAAAARHGRDGRRDTGSRAGCCRGWSPSGSVRSSPSWRWSGTSSRSPGSRWTTSATTWWCRAAGSACGCSASRWSWSGSCCCGAAAGPAGAGAARRRASCGPWSCGAAWSARACCSSSWPTGASSSSGI